MRALAGRESLLLALPRSDSTIVGCQPAAYGADRIRDASIFCVLASRGEGFESQTSATYVTPSSIVTSSASEESVTRSQPGDGCFAPFGMTKNRARPCTLLAAAADPLASSRFRLTVDMSLARIGLPQSAGSQDAGRR